MPAIEDLEYAACSPATMAKFCSGGRYKIAEHIQQINQKLIDVSIGRCKRLMVCMPPRHGKSELISKHFPAWYLGTYPERKILLTSYAASFAANWGRHSRDIYSDLYGVLFDTPMSKSVTRSDWWETAAGGVMSTAGVCGQTTGKGSHVFVLDDPVKNAQEAHSQKIRDNIYDWYLSTAFTRLESDPEGAVILIMTRWHEDDLAGRLLKENGEKSKGGEWETLIQPAIDDQGKALFPDRFPIDRLLAIKKTIGEYWWNALFMQRPSSRDGSVIKSEWFRKVPGFQPLIGVRFWDLAVTIQTSSDYSAGALCSFQDENFVIHDIEHGMWQWPETRRKIIECAKKDGPGVIVAVESFGQQMGFVDDLASLEEMRPYAIKPYAIQGDKFNRALPWASRAQLGACFLCEGPWITDFEEECDAFTKNDSHSHDDQIDAVSGAHFVLSEQAGSGIDVYERMGFGRR